MILPVIGTISSNFGMRNGKMHNGVDIAVPTGTNVLTLFGGKVTKTGNDASYGLYVTVKSGNVEELFAHLSKINVSQGNTIAAGKSIGLSGNTGNSTGPHLHYGIKVSGYWVDPLKYVDTAKYPNPISDEELEEKENNTIDSEGLKNTITGF